MSNDAFDYKENIYYQKGLELSRAFEENYIAIREKENRLYPDEVVLKLPWVSKSHPWLDEWRVREITMTNLQRHFGKKRGRSLILEIGCGNGWLAHRLADSVDGEIAGLDINETELLQGAKLFRDCQNLTFVYGDVFTIDFTSQVFDFILLASSVQYFPDVSKLIRRLFELLRPSGEIHIVDSPIYDSPREVMEAKNRSLDYFESQGVAEMADNYFHHALPALEDYHPRVMFHPHSPFALFKRKILRLPQSSFPWMMIRPL
jgi:ubiquinone/menaquinone biosynthesis C-methylase UbiE